MLSSIRVPEPVERPDRLICDHVTRPMEEDRIHRVLETAGILLGVPIAFVSFRDDQGGRPIRWIGAERLSTASKRSLCRAAWKRSQTSSEENSGPVLVASSPLFFQGGSCVGVFGVAGPPSFVTDERWELLFQTLSSWIASRLENVSLHRSRARLSSRLNEYLKLALTDPVSRVWNRAGWGRILNQQFELMNREGGSLGLIMLDVDHFKRVNDEYGHIAGDAVLAQTAGLIRRILRPYDTIGRFGGDEFVVLIPGCPADSIRSTAERIRDRVAGHRMKHGDTTLSVTLSQGIAIAGPAEGDAGDLIERADVQLRDAKRNGRNGISAA